MIGYCAEHKDQRKDAFLAAITTDCPYCRIAELEQQLTEANQKKETSATNARYYAEKCCQLETQLAEWDKLIQQLQKAFSDALINQAAQTQENTFLKEQLAERDAEIQVLRQIATVHKCVMDNTHIAEDEHIEKIAQLTKQLTASQQEVERLNQLKSIGDLTNMLAEARKQAAMECYEIGIKLLQQGYITMIISKYMDEIQDKFGLEG